MGQPSVRPWSATTTTPVPRQLPADVAGFTGRGAHLAELEALLAGRHPGHRPPR
jgi:hypothetical protein